jgi:hypothetical protein
MTNPSESPSSLRSGTTLSLRSAGWLSLVLGLLMAFCPGVHAEPSLSEYQVKALFLLNFAKYVEWPAEAFSGPSAPITIGVLGTGPCGDHLRKAVEGKTISGRAIVVHQIEHPEDMNKCHILFISGTEKNHLAEILSQLQSRPVLTVGENDQFAQKGGVIGFVKKDGKVRLEIDLKAARGAKLEISSKLLSVADRVDGK